MENHFYIIVIIIIGIVIWQFAIFNKTNRLLKTFKSIFRDDGKNYKLLYGNDLINKIKSITFEEELLKLLKNAGLESQKYYTTTYSFTESKSINSFNIEIAKQDLIDQYKNYRGFSTKNDNLVYRRIETSINSYLEKNKNGVSDFSLMKDIVDRNCDAVEEEINTQIPIPLYLGLVGTMIGILVGIGYLWISGGLSDLLNTTNSDLLNSNAVSASSAGVEALLGGVALAMISSILGILLTTFGSMRAKNIKSKVEKNKHIFLSWIQRELLPSLNSDVSGALIEMSRNLQEFNKTFSSNTNDLDKALSQINENTRVQTKLLETLKQAETRELSSQLMQNLNALQSSAKEIGTLAEYLNNCSSYLAEVQALNKRLDDSFRDTQFIKNANDFYSTHKNWLAENYDEANRELKKVVDKYNKAIEDIFSTIKSDIEGKRQDLGSFIDTQNAALKHSAGDLDKIVKALSELGEVQKGIKAFEAAIKGQNMKIERLADNIEKLANVKSSGGAIPLKQKTPIWQIALISVIALSCTVLAVKSFIKTEPKAVKTEIRQQQPVIQQPTVPVVKDPVLISDSTAVIE